MCAKWIDPGPPIGHARDRNTGKPGHQALQQGLSALRGCPRGRLVEQRRHCRRPQASTRPGQQREKRDDHSRNACRSESTSLRIGEIGADFNAPAPRPRVQWPKRARRPAPYVPRERHHQEVMPAMKYQLPMFIFSPGTAAARPARVMRATARRAGPAAGCGEPAGDAARRRCRRSVPPCGEDAPPSGSSPRRPRRGLVDITEAKITIA